MQLLIALKTKIGLSGLRQLFHWKKLARPLKLQFQFRKNSFKVRIKHCGKRFSVRFQQSPLIEPDLRDVMPPLSQAHRF